MFACLTFGYLFCLICGLCYVWLLFWCVMLVVCVMACALFLDLVYMVCLVSCCMFLVNLFYLVDCLNVLRWCFRLRGVCVFSFVSLLR